MSLKVAREQNTACATPVNSDPAYADIARHIPLGDPRQTSISQLLDQSVATPHEVQLLSERHDRLALCRKTQIDSYMAHAPAMGMVWIEQYGKADQNLLLLAKRQIKWGEYAARQKEIAEDTQVRMVAAGQRIDADLNASHQQEMAQRAQAAYQQQIFYQNQQMINNANRPITTNCNRFGSSTNCTTY